MTLPVNIESLIDGRVVECDRIEFKKGWNPDAIYRTIIEFTNKLLGYPINTIYSLMNQETRTYQVLIPRFLSSLFAE